MGLLSWTFRPSGTTKKRTAGHDAFFGQTDSVRGCPGANFRVLAECSLMPSNASFRLTKSIQPVDAGR